MSGRYELRFSGAGGQGLILAGVIMAEAASIYEGKQAVQSQSYGPEARGGASRADVIIADEPILYPKSRQLDVLVCLSQPAVDKYFEDLKVHGTAIIDSFYVHECPREGAVCAAMTETARAELGRELFTNIVMLGVLAQVTRAVKLESLERAVANRAPAKTLDLNKKALALGWQLGASRERKA